jgi:uroporphyrinogen-III synthase
MKVVITRPEADAVAWVKQLSERGHEVLALPLIEIFPTPDAAPLRQAWQHLSQYHAVMFVSGNAATQFAAAQEAGSLARWSQQAPLTRAWGTGPGTRRALLRAGVAANQIDAPATGQFDSEALWQLVQSSVRPGQWVLIVRGTDAHQTLAAAVPGVGRDWLAQALRSAGAEVDFVVAYGRRAPLWSLPQLALAQSAAQDGSLWLFSSAEAIGNLRQLLPQQDWALARALATHPRIAQAARDAGFGVVWESRPSLHEVVASIESMA